jgi:hypothetical protein
VFLRFFGLPWSSLGLFLSSLTRVVFASRIFPGLTFGALLYRRFAAEVHSSSIEAHPLFAASTISSGLFGRTHRFVLLKDEDIERPET